MALLDRAKGIVKLPTLAPLAPLGPDDIDEPEEEELQLTLIEHLDELRSRLIKAVIGLVIATALAFIVTPQLFELLLGPAPQAIKTNGLVFLEPTEAFLTYFQVALMAGIGLSSPWLLYQVIQFVLPALTRREKRLFYFFMPLVILFFFIGILFGYFITLRFALDFLIGFTVGGVLRPMITVGSYISFITTLLFWMGIAFETPIIIFFLSKIGVVNVRRLASYRKYAILAAFVLAAVITPTPDPLNQALVAIPLWILYEIGIVLARFA